MKKMAISLILIQALLLIGCGGSSSPTDTDDSKTETKSTIDKNKPLKSDENGKITTIQLSGSAEDIAVSKEALFVAKGEDGVDILKMGYQDVISSELVTAIDGINAKSVSLSEDGSRLYVENEQGFVNVINITNLSNPIKERITTKRENQNFVTTDDDNYKFIPKGKKGLEIYDISNPSNPELKLTFNKSNAYSIVLADSDTKALLAAGTTGINLLDITTKTMPNMVANFSLDGDIRGLSLNEDQGLLFVANGDKGVLVYHLNIMLDMLYTSN